MVRSDAGTGRGRCCGRTLHDRNPRSVGLALGPLADLDALLLRLRKRTLRMCVIDSYIRRGRLLSREGGGGADANDATTTA